MEEDIKVIERWIEKDKEYRIVTVFDEKPLFRDRLENLIKGYRELEYKYDKALTDLSIEAKRTNEENYRCSLFAVENNDLKEKLADSIPKSKIKEMIEYYKKLGDEFYEKFLETNKTDIDIHDAGISCDAKARVLQELLEEKEETNDTDS